MATARWLVVTARWFCGRQVLLRLRGYISVCPTLQLSHNDVPGVGLGGCWNQVVPSHSRFCFLNFFRTYFLIVLADFTRYGARPAWQKIIRSRQESCITTAR